MSFYLDCSNLRETRATTSDIMCSFNLSERRSGRYEGVNGIFTCPVPTTSAKREEMKASLRGSAETPLPSGPQITMVSSSKTVDASGLSYGGNTVVGLSADRDPDRSAKLGGNKSQESERTTENAQTVKRNPQVTQRPDSEQQPQIYPWMTKLHMNHGKVWLYLLKWS